MNYSPERVPDGSSSCTRTIKGGNIRKKKINLGVGTCGPSRYDFSTIFFSFFAGAEKYPDPAAVKIAPEK
jgi:hypothetical protein